jgi:hypothetical protein
MTIPRAEAIKSLDNDAQFSIQHLTDGDVITWHTTPINDEKIDTELSRLQAEYDAQAYSRKREAEYPSIQECVHAILDDTLDALQAKRASVKLKYPKGG